MFKIITNGWKILLVKGLLLIALSLLIFANPTTVAATLVMWVAVLIIFDGVLTCTLAIQQWQDKDHSWRFLLEGVLGIILGSVLLFTPEVTLLFIGMLMAFFFVFVGINRIFMGIRLRKEITGEGWVIFNGIISLFVGLLIASQPFVGVSSIMYFLALGLLLVGLALVFLALKFRKGKKQIEGKLDELKNTLKEK